MKAPTFSAVVELKVALKNRIQALVYVVGCTPASDTGFVEIELGLQGLP